MNQSQSQSSLRRGQHTPPQLDAYNHNRVYDRCAACNRPTRSQPCTACDVRTEDYDPREEVFDPEYLGNPHAEALAELKETLLAWQRGKEEIDQSLEDMAPNSSRRRRQLYRSQRDLLDSLSPAAREIFVGARDVVIDSMCFRSADNDGEIEVDSWSVLVL